MIVAGFLFGFAYCAICVVIHRSRGVVITIESEISTRHEAARLP